MPRQKQEWVGAEDVEAPAAVEPSTMTLPNATVSSMLEALLSQSKSLAQQVERTAPKENPNYQVQSYCLKPNGEPHAADLQCDIYVGPSLLNRTPLTAEEVRQANRLRPVAKFTIQKMDRTTVVGSVTGRFNASDQLERLTVALPMAQDDNPQMYPPLDDLLRQIADAGEREHGA